MQDAGSSIPSEEPEEPFSRQKLVSWWQQIKVVPPLEGRKTLREWWHEILRNYGLYPCYAIFLGLPADTELRKYFNSFYKELEIVSGDKCLVMILSNQGFWYNGFKEDLIHLDGYISEGQSVPIAKVFGIGFEQFPCLVIFTDVRSSEHIIISLRDLEADKLAIVVRSTFSTIDKALSQNENPLKALERNRTKQEFLDKGKNVMSGIRNFAGKTLDVVVEAWIKTIIK